MIKAFLFRIGKFVLLFIVSLLALVFLSGLIGIIASAIFAYVSLVFGSKIPIDECFRHISQVLITLSVLSAIYVAYSGSKKENWKEIVSSFS